jgi:putative DNA primase/helicase
VTAERKGQDPFDFNNYAKLLFSANNIPRIKDKSGAVLNRLIIIPFNATFSRDDPDFDPYIKYKLRKEESMRYLIQIGLDGLARVLDNQGFTEGMSVQNEWKAYEEYNNPVLMFFKEGAKIENELVNDVYTKYVKFCTNNGFTPMSKIEFSRQICKSLGLVSKQRKVKGEVIRIYVKEGGE